MQSSEPEKPVELEEKVDLDGDNDVDEVIEEEVEYEELEEEEVEEIEEEEEVEEEEEEEEEEEGEEEEEVEEEEEEDDDAADGGDAQKSPDGDDEMIDDEEEKKNHAELLTLPPHGYEVYLGGIRNDVSKEDFRGFCKSIGEASEVRVMKGKDSGNNKGFAFMTFRSVDLASKAIEKLNMTEFKSDGDLKKVVMNVGPGVTSVKLVKDMKNSSNNRGFCFIEYYNHQCAEYSRKKMINPKFRLDDNAPTVKAVYVKSLPKHVTQDQLKKLFEHHGKITKIVLPHANPGQEKSRIGFVHFALRSSAFKALKNTEKYESDGQDLECSLAERQVDQKSSGASNLQKTALLPNHPPRIGYRMVGGAYGALGAGYNAGGFVQPLIYGRPNPAGMAMMLMLLPDGRVGYVLQQPGAQLPHTPPPPQRVGSGQGASGSGRRVVAWAGEETTVAVAKDIGINLLNCLFGESGRSLGSLSVTIVVRCSKFLMSLLFKGHVALLFKGNATLVPPINMIV
ncbi:RNA recognition motif domain [Dillenia turbinata]|uniref:RNA recognition motif domain n=1 Tax=Dillenia turbinata TaxID=194707 RepID=A0AAN8VHW5_9MAGN